MNIIKKNDFYYSFNMSVDLNDPSVLHSFSEKLLKLSHEIDLPGYQKGHIPHNIIISHYRDQIMREICGEKVDQALKKVLNDNNYIYLYYSEFIVKEQKLSEDSQQEMLIHLDVNFSGYPKDDFKVPSIIDSFKIFLKEQFESPIYTLAYLAPECLIKSDQTDADYVLMYDMNGMVPVSILKKKDFDIKNNYNLLIDYVSIDFEILKTNAQQNETLKNALESLNKQYIHSLFDAFLSQKLPKEIQELNHFHIPSELASKITYKESDIVLRYLLDNNEEIRQFDFSKSENYAYALLFSNNEINTYVSQLS